MDRQVVLRAALAQINTTVGDLPGNLQLVAEAYQQAISAGATLVVFPELTLTGYPPEDLLLKRSFLEDTRAALEQLAAQADRGLVLVGFAESDLAGIWNSAALIGSGRILDTYRKCALPNYGVFDERRYFRPATRCPVYVAGPWRLAVNICEDLWIDDGAPRVQALQGRANLMVNLMASPYHARKGAAREALAVARARAFRLPLLYNNLVGGQDELVFDGQSLAVDPSGRVIARAPQFEPHLLLVDLAAPAPPAGGEDDDIADRGSQTVGGEGAGGSTPSSDRHPEPLPLQTGPALHLDVVPLDPALLTPSPAVARVQPMDALRGPVSLGTIARALGEDEEVYRALCLGLRDYVRKNGFRGVVIGLSGGIDSALTAVIAADALGPDAVTGISMPSPYSSAETRAGARELARNLGIAFHEIPITGIFAAATTELAAHLGDHPPDVTEENLQARIRGMILMAWSNKLGHMVLATGNKSEVAVGYCTLYGDMVGGFSVLKDVFKTHVYRLARWRNAQPSNLAALPDTPGPPPIPQDTLTRPPSAELKPDQKDTDSLPPYEILDPIVKALVEDEASPRDVVAAGYARETVDRVFKLIQGNEYKRRQAAPGIKITPRAFGRDRRYPLTNRYRPLAERG